MTTLYNYTQSATTGIFYLQTWFIHESGTVIDEGRTGFKTYAKLKAALLKYIDAQPLTQELVTAYGLTNVTLTQHQ